MIFWRGGNVAIPHAVNYTKNTKNIKVKKLLLIFYELSVASTN